MNRRDRLLAIAVVLSLAIHLAALFGTPRFDFGWREDAAPAAPLEATIVALEAPPPRAAPAQAPAPRAQPAPAAPAPRAQPAPAAPAPRVRPSAPAEPAPAQSASTSLLTAPSPDGEAVPDARALAGPPAADGPEEPAGQPAAQPIPDAPADYPLRRARLVYDLYYLTSLEANNPTKVGQVTHRWSQDGHRYEVESVAEAVGFLTLLFSGKFVQRSTGEIRADGLHPAEYTLDRGNGARTEVARFDWPEGKLALAWKDRSQTIALPAAAQDPLSLMHQLYFLRQIPAFGTLAVATSRKLYRSAFELVGGETLVVPLGAVRTLHFRRREPDGTTTELWADLDRSLLPARVRAIDKRGNVVDQVIREAELETAAPRGD